MGQPWKGTAKQSGKNAGRLRAGYPLKTKSGVTVSKSKTPPNTLRSTSNIVDRLDQEEGLAAEVGGKRQRRKK